MKHEPWNWIATSQMKSKKKKPKTFYKRKHQLSFVLFKHLEKFFTSILGGFFDLQILFFPEKIKKNVLAIHAHHIVWNANANEITKGKQKKNYAYKSLLELSKCKKGKSHSKVKGAEILWRNFKQIKRNQMTLKRSSLTIGYCHRSVVMSQKFSVFFYFGLKKKVY